MGLKQLIKERRLMASGAVDAKLTLPGEPLIYSIKYDIGMRHHKVDYFRNLQWRSLFKCFFNAYLSKHIPVVIIVRFYVTPREGTKISKHDLKKEKTPATHNYEICEYLLSFMDMLRKVLIDNYRQIVKIDAEKYYSDNPRTVFQFMKWDHYEYLQNNNSVHTKPEGKHSARKKARPRVQPKCEGDGDNKELCGKKAQRQEATTTKRSALGYYPFSYARTAESAKPIASPAPPEAAHQEAGWGQPGEVPE